MKPYKHLLLNEFNPFVRKFMNSLMMIIKFPVWYFLPSNYVSIYRKGNLQTLLNHFEPVYVFSIVNIMS